MIREIDRIVNEQKSKISEMISNNPNKGKEMDDRDLQAEFAVETPEQAEAIKAALKAGRIRISVADGTIHTIRISQALPKMPEADKSKWILAGLGLRANLDGTSDIKETPLHDLVRDIDYRQKKQRDELARISELVYAIKEACGL